MSPLNAPLDRSEEPSLIQRYKNPVLDKANALVSHATGFTSNGYLRVDAYENLILLVARLLERAGDTEQALQNDPVEPTKEQR